MDVGAYFQNVLSTSYMVRVQFGNADYGEVTGREEAAKRPTGKGTKRKKRGANERYTSYPATLSLLDEGAMPSESLNDLLAKLKDFDRAEAERKDCLQVLIARHILRGNAGTVDGTYTHEALLVLPANVSMSGELTYPADWKGRAPWMPRPLLEEATAKGASKAEIAIGAYADYDAFVSSNVAVRDRIDKLSGREQWKAYVSYAESLYEHVFDCSPENLETCELHVDEEALYVLIDDSVNASAPIEELYQRIRTQGGSSPELNLYRSITNLEQRNQVVARLDDDGLREALDHAGAASREYPLAASQRLAVHRHGMLADGEVLAVSGPPGTGKTTLLQSIVADLLVHRALEDKPRPPVIVGASTNNQAVTNIVDAFTKDVKQQQGTSVFRRWLPDIVIDEDGKGYAVNEDEPMHSLGVYSPSAAKKGVALQKGYLVDDLSRRQDGLYQRCINRRYSSKAPAVYCQQASAFLGKSCTRPGEAMIAVHDTLRRVDRLRRELLEVVASGQGAPDTVDQRCKEIVGKLAHLGAVSEAGKPIALEACGSLKSLDEALDTTVRPLEFWLAVHVFEGMWLTAKWLKNTAEDKQLNSYKREHVGKYREQMAALMPLTVMTMFRLPRQFVYENADGQRDRANFGAIDLLIVDEAGQVDAAVGAAAFSLAKRAVVVGDVFQLPPVWGLEPDSDFLIAQGFMEPGEDQKATWEQLRARGLTASRNSSVMAAAQSASPWAYEMASAVGEEEDFSFWDEDDDDDDGSSMVSGGLFLSEHRRCVDSIIQYCNDLLYGGKLEPKRGDKRKAEIGLPPMGFCPVDGRATLAGTSRKNPREAQAIATWISQNIVRLWSAYNEASDDGVSPKKVIGVVTPFSAQAREVKEQLGKLGNEDFGGESLGLTDIVTVGTAHKLQGAECPVVLFSLVYDGSSNASFVENNPNLMNVAVSRAKDAFIVFGSESLMANAGGNGVMGLLNYYCYDNKVDPPAMSAKATGGGWAKQNDPLSFTKARIASIEDGFWPESLAKVKVKEINARLAEGDKSEKVLVGKKQQSKKGGKRSDWREKAKSDGGWSTKTGKLPLGKAIPASIADGFWPDKWSTDVLVKDVHERLAEEDIALLESPDGSHYRPTAEGESIGIGCSDHREDGSFWPLFSEFAMREIAHRLSGE